MSRQTPSFSGLKAASDASSRTKQANSSTDTLHEQLLRKALWRRGVRYRKNVRTLPGKPDLVFPGVRVAVFCDGDFWHGKNWDTLKKKLESGYNSSYWPAKIARNIERDQRNTSQLEADGWLVLRFWESDIRRSPDEIAERVIQALCKRRPPGVTSRKCGIDRLSVDGVGAT